ncbi:iron chelate uptake ABC transporter family permease subunit [Arthrobacter pityocampae]|uniref:iron chelate uptake ABC transporter family permease subunit n=1 Tax=Arthrobacter pityocampae TaxID=547334 RepID=UPI003735BA7A
MRARTGSLPSAVVQSARKPLRTMPPAAWLTVLGVTAAALIAAFLLVGLEGNPAYVLPRRLNRIGAMVLVAVAVGVSTVLFQTVTGNRILTPSIMGLDALYLLIQTVLVFVLGAGTLLTLGAPLRFGVEVSLLVGFSWLLYRWLFLGSGRSLHLLLLVGIVFGVFFRGASSLLQRLMDPSEFIILQDLFFASFNRVDPLLLLISAVAVVGLCVPAWRLRHRLDVLALGRETAVGLGVDYRRTVTLVLVICSVLVAVSTALVGPSTFFGLLVSALAYQLCSQFRHAVVLPVAVLLGVIALVGGQLVLEQVLAFDTALSIVIEFTGGIVFLVLLLKGRIR